MSIGMARLLFTVALAVPLVAACEITGWLLHCSPGILSLDFAAGMWSCLIVEQIGKRLNKETIAPCSPQ